jgi:hypothetical protein
MSEETPYHLELEDRIESLYARVATLEARVAELSSSVNPFRVTPEGMLSFDVRKRIEALEEQTPEEFIPTKGGPAVPP